MLDRNLAHASAEATTKVWQWSVTAVHVTPYLVLQFYLVYTVQPRLYEYRSIIDQYFGGRFACELKCTESEEEQPAHSEENFLQLSCFINQDVKYMHSGLKLVSSYNFHVQTTSINGIIAELEWWSVKSKVVGNYESN